MYRPTLRLAALLLLPVLGALPAAAQGQRPANPQTLVLPGIMPDPGVVNRRAAQRLEPGSVLCRTVEALNQRQTALARANATGEDEPALPAGCVMLSRRIGVEVLERRGTGRTKVKTLATPPEEGWTDAWLPAR